MKPEVQVQTPVVSSFCDEQLHLLTIMAVNIIYILLLIKKNRLIVVMSIVMLCTLILDFCLV
jgi:hypothetical protein